MKLFSPAKINLFLYVTGKRQNGYHDLYTLMCPINLSDTIFLNFNCNKVSVECPHKDIPDNKNNIAYKAANLFLKTVNADSGVEIFIEKKIPVGAGLGGGSSNAATILMGLNKFFNNPLTKDELLLIGLKLGADVPFFIFENPAIATGIGEILEYCQLTPYYVILIYPGIHISTTEIYKKVNLTLTNSSKQNKNFLLQVKKNLPKNLPFNIQEYLWNDLETVTTNLYFEINELKKILLNYNAEGVLMSGSGSTVFGLYSDKNIAQNTFHALKAYCKKFIKKEKQWELHITELLI